MIKKSFLWVRIGLLAWAMLMLSLLDSVGIKTSGQTELEAVEAREIYYGVIVASFSSLATEALAVQDEVKVVEGLMKKKDEEEEPEVVENL